MNVILVIFLCFDKNYKVSGDLWIESWFHVLFGYILRKQIANNSAYRINHRLSTDRWFFLSFLFAPFCRHIGYIYIYIYFGCNTLDILSSRTKTLVWFTWYTIEMKHHVMKAQSHGPVYIKSVDSHGVFREGKLTNMRCWTSSHWHHHHDQRQLQAQVFSCSFHHPICSSLLS